MRDIDFARKEDAQELQEILWEHGMEPAGEIEEHVVLKKNGQILAGAKLASLGEAAFEPDVVILTLWSEQAMWVCYALTYAIGERQMFKTSGYNSTCVDLVVTPMKSGLNN